MLGLLLKDLYSLKRYVKFLVIYMVVFGLLFSQNGEAGVVGAMVAVLVMTLSISSFGYDEYAKWDSYAACLPISRRQVVASKYLLVLVLMVVGAAFSMLFVLGYHLFVPASSLLEGTVAVGATTILCATMVSVVIPFIYKFGAEKSRIITVLVFALPSLAIVFLVRLLPMPSEEALSAFLTQLLLVSPLLCLAIIAFSYTISVYLYRRKEF